jgi:hypothetical protein
MEPFDGWITFKLTMSIVICIKVEETLGMKLIHKYVALR